VPLDPDDMIRSFEARVGEQTQRALQVSAELEAVAATVQSDGGEVTVRVNSAGGLADLRFHSKSDGLPRDELARLVLATSRRAQARLAEQVSQIVSGMYGGSSDTAAFITDAYASRYPAVDDGEEQR
jgi:DNA-binding protein YbaB